MLKKADTSETVTEPEEMAHIAWNYYFNIVLQGKEIGKTTQTIEEIESQCGSTGLPYCLTGFRRLSVSHTE